MINFNDLRSDFAELSFEQREEFLHNLGEQIKKMPEGEPKNQYRNFLTECINVYKEGVKANEKPTPKAPQVSGEALREQGRQYLYGLNDKERDVKKGIELLERAARKHDEGALVDLVKFYTQRYIKPEHTNLVYDYLKLLATTHTNALATIRLGAIYCAAPENRDIVNYPQLAVKENRAVGFQLINTGYDNAKRNKISIDCFMYESMIEAYFHVKHLGRQGYEVGKETDCPFWSQGHKSFERLVLLLKEATLAWREGRGLPAKYPQEAKDAMVKMNLRCLATLLRPQEVEAFKKTWQ